jgi:TonB family protein
MLLAAIVLSGGLLAEDVPEFQTLRVNIVSPPPVALGEPTPAPEEEAVVPVEAEADPEPVPEPPAVEEKPPEARPAEQKPPETSAPPPPAVEEKKEPEQSTGARPDPESTGGDNLNVVQDGQLFDFPWYTDNIVLQLHRYFRWSGSPDREVGLMFAIERDGSVTSVDIQRRSGNPRFDLAAVQAVNMAARNEEFGPLPEDFVKERLWVRFTFVPQK